MLAITEDRIASLILVAYKEQRLILERLKQEAISWGEHEDWPWNGIVRSVATRSNSRAWLAVRPRYTSGLSWSVLSSLSDDERREKLSKIGRFSKPNAIWLENAFQQIRTEGGPQSLRAKIAKGKMNAYEVLQFWQTINGMGPKYARNLMMDVYDERFRSGHFAIDSRIKNLLPKLNYYGSCRYDDQEKFLID